MYLQKSRIKTSVARKVLEADPRFRFCLSPKCTAGQIHENRETMIVVCKTCGAQSCFIHGIPYHKGQTCDQYNSMYPDASTMLISEERIKTTVKKCPGFGCSYYVEKDGGCSNMYCPNCSQDWVWDDVGFGDE